MKRTRIVLGSILLWVLAAPTLAEGDSVRGARAFGLCAACHALEPGRHMTGPSLGGLWGRKAGTAPGFARYSPALRGSGLVWNDATLDTWLANPAEAVPGNYMQFGGISDARVRSDLIAFLRVADQGEAPAARRAPSLPDLKAAPSSAVVSRLRHCGDTYFVTNAEGKTLPFWEFNLRFKTDSGASGPAPGRPVLVGQGMQGDRAQVVFARYDEISAFIREDCLK
ncbi:MAG TPA: cytochrome C [Burkholderiales bacterium]|nr:cytochrome C [Burkholderiales bacterium]